MLSGDFFVGLFVFALSENGFGGKGSGAVSTLPGSLYSTEVPDEDPGLGAGAGSGAGNRDPIMNPSVDGTPMCVMGN